MMVKIVQKPVKINTVPKGLVVTLGIEDERAIVMHTGAMGTRVNVTANYLKYRNGRKVTDGFTLGEQIWSAITSVYIVEE